MNLLCRNLYAVIPQMSQSHGCSLGRLGSSVRNDKSFDCLLWIAMFHKRITLTGRRIRRFCFFAVVSVTILLLVVWPTQSHDFDRSMWQEWLKGRVEYVVDDAIILFMLFQLSLPLLLYWHLKLANGENFIEFLLSIWYKKFQFDSLAFVISF